MKRICVFCGSSPGADPRFRDAAMALGRCLASAGVTTVYGGARVGLMGILADAALASGGAVIGVLPQALARKEIGHTGLTELRIVGSMHERKQQMADLADAFIALPGGTGTWEEFTEVFTWAQLGMHRKPCGLLNVSGYYDHLIAQFDHAVKQRFVSEAHRLMLLVGDTPEGLLGMFASYQPPVVAKWLDRETA